MLINGLCKPSLKAPDHVTKMLPAEHGQKVDDFEPIYLGRYRFGGKWFVFFEQIINRLSLWYVRLPQPEYYFSSFFSFFLLFFLFLLKLSTFKPLNALYLKFERLEISRRTRAGMKSGVPGWGDPPRTGPPKLWTFKPLKLDTSKFWNR